jgi:hypothetical protein
MVVFDTLICKASRDGSGCLQMEVFWKNDGDYLYMALKGRTDG